jgi:hypothetical protein
MGVHVIEITGRLILPPGGDVARRAAGRFDRVANEQLTIMGNELALRLRTFILQNEVRPPKKHPDGKPTLVDMGVYVKSIQARTSGLTCSISAEGQNTYMSNNALADLLEYGWAGAPPRPHWRIAGIWAEKNLPVLGERIGRALFAAG